MKKACSKAHCAEPAISQVGVCAYHYAEGTWWTEWAAKCYPEQSA